jgi:hypothetical protein
MARFIQIRLMVVRVLLPMSEINSPNLSRPSRFTVGRVGFFLIQCREIECPAATFPHSPWAVGPLRTEAP